MQNLATSSDRSVSSIDTVTQDSFVAATRSKARHVVARSDMPTTDTVGVIGLVVRGWVCAFRHLPDGRWQIVSFYLPGDLFQLSQDGDETHLRTMMDCIICQTSAPTFGAAAQLRPQLRAALDRSQALHASSMREWVVSLGRRTARERCAHLICELYWRLRASGHVREGTMDFPLTQEEVGGTIGVSTVHANRVLQDIRIAGLIEQNGKRLTVLDLPALQRMALFSPRFLGIEGGGSADAVATRFEERKPPAPPVPHTRAGLSSYLRETLVGDPHS